MVPSSTAAIYSFLGLVAPGLLYQLLRERARPTLEETGFREASRVALASLAFTTASVLVLTAISDARPSWFFDGPEWVEQGSAYAKGHPELVVRSVVLAIALSCLFAALASLYANWLGDQRLWLVKNEDDRWRIGRTARSGRRVTKNDVWYQLLIEDVPNDKAPWVVLAMKDGNYFWGHVDLLTAGRSLDDRQIVLKGPKLQSEPPGSKLGPQLDKWERISVRVADIAHMKVRYGPRAQTKAGATAPADAAEQSQ